MNKYIATTAAGLALLTAAPASALPVTEVEGTIGSSSDVDYFLIQAAGGTATFDVLAQGWTGGPTGNGSLDSTIWLFDDDGSPIGALTGAHVDDNDDHDGWDSYLSVSLIAGAQYILVISDYDFGEADARSDHNAAAGNIGDYKITITGAEVIAWPLSEPAALGLFGLGLMGLGFATQRRGAASKSA